MKQLVSLLLCLFLLASCGLRQSGQPESETPPELLVIGVSQVGSESGFRVANTESIRSVFSEEAGYHLLFEDARQKQENQITAIRKFIQQQVDCILLMPLCVTGWDSVLQEAKAAGIPVILVDRTIEVADDSLYAAHVGGRAGRGLAGGDLPGRKRTGQHPAHPGHLGLQRPAGPERRSGAGRPDP